MRHPLSAFLHYRDLQIRTVAMVLLAPAVLLARVRTGTDIFVEGGFQDVAGKRIGIIANQNSLTSDHRSVVDLLIRSPKVKVTAIFAPEHGLTVSQQAGDRVKSESAGGKGIPVYSLYDHGPHGPTAEQLRDVDVLVFDLQDVGARFWTYTTTLGRTLESAAKNHKPVLVLDWPNPINGIAVEGPMLDDKYFSGIGYGRRPVRHGMTMGELAQFFNGENRIGADLHVIKMSGWERRQWLDETGLEWITPSPNLRNLTAEILYPGTCLVESTLFSVGRGTDTPFQMVGAPWLKQAEVADYLNAQRIPGVRFMARRFLTTEEPYKGQTVTGLDVQLLDRNALNSPEMGLAMLAALVKFHPQQFVLDRKILLLLGNDRAAALLKQGKSAAEINASFAAELDAFRKVRAKYLLY